MTTGKLGVWGPTFGLRWSAGSVEGARYRLVSPSRREARRWIVPEHLDVKERSLATEYSAMPDSCLTTHPQNGKGNGQASRLISIG